MSSDRDPPTPEELREALGRAMSYFDESPRSRDGDTSDHLRWLSDNVSGLIEDRARMDWLDAEHQRVDPVARLVVKRRYDRNGHAWADVAESSRTGIDSARSSSSVPPSDSNPSSHA